MRRDLTGNLHAISFPTSHKIETMRRGEMLDVDWATRKRRNFDVACNLDFLTSGRPTEQPEPRGNDAFVYLAFSYQAFILAMAAHGLPELCSVIHNAPHHAR